MLRGILLLIMMITTLFSVSAALAALPGPLPPAPPPIPALPTTGYNHYTILQAPSGNPDQQVFGTPENDMIAQYGDADTVSQYAEGGEGTDWLL
jgi:hypothetical protein